MFNGAARTVLASSVTFHTFSPILIGLVKITGDQRLIHKRIFLFTTLKTTDFSHFSFECRHQELRVTIRGVASPTNSAVLAIFKIGAIQTIFASGGHKAIHSTVSSSHGAFCAPSIGERKAV